MTEFDKIHLVWKKGASHRRVPVGLLERSIDDKYIFKYNAEIKDLQKTEGVTLYTEFQDVDKTYNGNVADIFGQRLMKIDRPDINNFFNFWEVDKEKANNKFYLLGKTQGLVPTDNFEFLAEYKLVSNLHFLTELASLSIQDPKLKRDSISVGDRLNFLLEPNNPKDKNAVKVFKDDLFLGYIKRFHCKVFYEAGAEKLYLSVKAIEQNGFIKRVFIKVVLTD